ncbi:MAG: efflux RND transporter periplasmic adaptor subunit, partial [Burkholderiaceae bacterium]|nr:efflux RND transporter periplasmic adaptor subunit [Burkholderiaceae bacterium]
MKRFFVVAAALAGLAGAGWWGYSYNRGGQSSALEIGGKADPSAGRADAARTPGKAGAGNDAKGPGKPGDAAAKGPRGPIGVEASRAEHLALADEISAVGNLRANETVVMKPEIAGRIVKIGFSDGARVPRGAPLIELDGSVLAAQAEQTRAELSLAKASFERTEDLAKRNFVSSSARDQAAANLKVQEARLQLAEAQLAKTRINAPFAGVLGLRNVSLGDFVKDGAELVVLEDVTSMKVDLRLPERYLGQLRRGQVITLSVDAFPGREYKAVLDALDSQIDANGRSVLARGRLP